MKVCNNCGALDETVSYVPLYSGNLCDNCYDYLGYDQVDDDNAVEKTIDFTVNE